MPSKKIVKKEVIILKCFYLLLGIVLILLPMIKPALWIGSDENFVSFPFSFGLVFLVIAYVLGRGKDAAKRGILTTAIMLAMMTLYLTDNHSGNIIAAPFILLFASMGGFAFVYTWVPYSLGLMLLSATYSGNETKKATPAAVKIAVIVLVLFALAWFAVDRFWQAIHFCLIGIQGTLST